MNFDVKGTVLFKKNGSLDPFEENDNLANKKVMPSIKTITPVNGGSFYHIFNRGPNRQNLFYIESNYQYFLQLLHKFLSGYLHFLSYCLLPNHFHFVIKVYDELDLEFLVSKENRSLHKERFFNSEKDRYLKDESKIGKLVVRQLKRLFITYSMAINKQERRVGNLFEPKYKRIEITEQDYLEYAIFYTHYNPEKHGYVNNFRTYKYSSYKALSSELKTNLDRKYVWDLFGGKEAFLNYHSTLHEERSFIILE